MSFAQTATRSDQRFFAHPSALVESDDIGLGTRIWAFAHGMTGAHVRRDCNIGEHYYIETGAVLGVGREFVERVEEQFASYVGCPICNRG